jgi:hypothetical protein
VSCSTGSRPSVTTTATDTATDTAKAMARRRRPRRRGARQVAEGARVRGEHLAPGSRPWRPRPDLAEQQVPGVTPTPRATAEPRDVTPGSCPGDPGARRGLREPVPAGGPPRTRATFSPVDSYEDSNGPQQQRTAARRVLVEDPDDEGAGPAAGRRRRRRRTTRGRT